MGNEDLFVQSPVPMMKLHMGTHSCNPSPGDGKRGAWGSLTNQSSFTPEAPCLVRETLSQNRNVLGLERWVSVESVCSSFRGLEFGSQYLSFVTHSCL